MQFDLVLYLHVPGILAKNMCVSINYFCSNSIIAKHLKPITTTITGHMKSHSQAHHFSQWSQLTHTQFIQLIITRYWLKCPFSHTTICMFCIGPVLFNKHLNWLIQYACHALAYVSSITFLCGLYNIHSFPHWPTSFQ